MHTVPGGLWMRPMGSARSIGYIVRKVSKPVQWYAYTNVDHTSIQVSLVVNAQITRHVTPKYFVSWTISPPPTFRFSPAVGCAPLPARTALGGEWRTTPSKFLYIEHQKPDDSKNEIPCPPPNPHNTLHTLPYPIPKQYPPAIPVPTTG